MLLPVVLNALQLIYLTLVRNATIAADTVQR
jgi:hypothetical protein